MGKKLSYAHPNTGGCRLTKQLFENTHHYLQVTTVACFQRHWFLITGRKKGLLCDHNSQPKGQSAVYNRDHSPGVQVPAGLPPHPPQIGPLKGGPFGSLLGEARGIKVPLGWVLASEISVSRPRGGDRGDGREAVDARWDKLRGECFQGL